MDILKQSTAVTIVMGPMLDSTDGNTPETALTIAQADIRLSKNGGAFAQTNNVAGATHMEVGKYSVPLDTTDTGTLGKLRVDIHESGALAVWREYTIVPANVYDTLVLGTDVLTADVTQWLGTAVTANVAGQPTVDVTRVGASTQSLIDLKDFVDSGYDPATNKVQGVVLADTVTTLTGHTAQTGDSYAVVNHADHGNAKLVRSTTPANALDVSATGESGLDFANIKDATGAHTLTNITIPTVTTTATATDLTNAPTNGDLTATMKTSVNAEVDTALTDINLDHLVKSAVDTNFATTVHLDSVVGQMVDVGTSATFDRTTDSNEAIRNKQTDIETDTAEIGTAGAGLTDLGGMSTGMKGEVNAEADTALTDYDPPTDTEMIARTLPTADYVVTTDTIAGVTTATNLTNAPTNGDFTATMKTSVNTEAKDVLTVDTIADSYATDGNQPTIAQAILAIQQFAQEKSISGTTLTVKKPDGSTTAMTFTLDHATEPTSLTRAT